MTTAGTHQVPIDTDSFVGTSAIEGHFHSTSLYLVPAGHSWGQWWRLTNHLCVEIRTSRSEVLAVTFLSIEEYGVGDSVETAISDLLTSLSDYYESLTSREERLASSALEDLSRLRHLIGQTPTI